MISEGLVVADARLAYRHDLSKFVEMSLYGLRSANQLQKREQQKRRLQDIKVWIHRKENTTRLWAVSQEFLRSLIVTRRQSLQIRISQDRKSVSTLQIT